MSSQNYCNVIGGEAGKILFHSLQSRGEGLRARGKLFSGATMTPLFLKSEKLKKERVMCMGVQGNPLPKNF